MQSFNKHFIKQNCFLHYFRYFTHNHKFISSTFRHSPYFLSISTSGTCAKRSLRSAWVSAQTDQSSMSAWRKLGSLANHWAHSEDSDQTGRMPRLIWVFAGRTCHFICFVMRWLILWGGEWGSGIRNYDGYPLYPKPFTAMNELVEWSTLFTFRPNLSGYYLLSHLVS